MPEKKHQKPIQKSESKQKDSIVQRRQTTINQTTGQNQSPFIPYDLLYLQGAIGNQAVNQLMRKSKSEKPMQQKKNNTGLPDNLKNGIEQLSGLSMDDVRVHLNSPKPDTVQALAHTQGRDIHVAPGQEKHLAHEAWHVVQQKQGRVKPTGNVAGIPLNDSRTLETEADVMGQKALQKKKREETESPDKSFISSSSGAVQLTTNKIIQLTCKICGAKSHSTAKCPKNEKSKEKKEGGRSITKGNSKQKEIMEVLISKLDIEAMYDEGAKSLVGGRNGKPSGFKDISIRIDRQGTGNVQFQIGDFSYAGVTFDNETEPDVVLAGLRKSFNDGKMVDLRK